MYEAGYPAPQDFRAPPSWRLSTGGVPIPPPPRGAAMAEEIERVLAMMSDEEHGHTDHHPDNHAAWEWYFRDRFERDLRAYDGPPPMPIRNNAESRRRWWSTPGRMLTTVLEQIEDGNFPVLQIPPPPPCSFSRHWGSSWTPWRMATSSSSASGSRSRSPGSAPPSTPRHADMRVKLEPVSPPCTRARGSIVISEWWSPASPEDHLCLVRPKREPGSSSGLLTPKRDPAPAVCACQRRSLRSGRAPTPRKTSSSSRHWQRRSTTCRQCR
uniref:Uncharacterized protein n=1 Tax=Avena sativa TaxID=4498 RepID=A0ACD5Y2N6_AVESA